MKHLFNLFTLALVSVSTFYASAIHAAPATSVKATKATIIKSEQLEALEPNVVKFVSKYCLDCHNDKTTKGDRNFLEFLQNPEHEDNHVIMEEMLDELNFGSMPEEKDGVPKPNSKEIKNAIQQMTVYLSDTLEKQKPTETPLRKLSKIEYINSLRDLLHISPITNGAIAQFPKDPNTHGFTNISEYQTLSKHQLNLYVEAAKENIDKAIAFDKKKPNKKRYSIKPKRFAKTEKFNNGGVYYRVLERKGRYIDIGHGQLNERYPTYPSTLEDDGVHESGTYTITVSAEAIGRQNPYSPKVLKHDVSDYMKLAIGYGDNINSLQPSIQSGRHLLKVFDVADNQENDFTINVTLPKGAIPYIYWINGPGSAKAITNRVMRKYHPEAIRMTKGDREKIIAQGKPAPQKQTHYASDVYRGPRIRVHKMVIEGPIETQWPPKSHVALVGNSLDPEDVDIEKALLKFSNNAFRQPIKLDDIQKYIDFVEHKIANGTDRAEAIKLGFNAILISPRFLYFSNKEGASEGKTEKELFQQKQFELANRLSYMLWRSIPDEKLLTAAKKGQLATVQQLWEQADRMLLDARAKAFTTGFVNAWLRLDKLGEMPPGERQFSDYYRYRLETAMRSETEILFTYILNYNLPVSDFLTADYTFINDGLAKLYDIKNVNGEIFQKVKLPETSQRRGLLGHASILTASANGVDTSPVLRGVWILESILGTPPPPPPPDVPTIEPDTRGATTIRQQLEKHRNIEACADCHANIDPWGFPLENYDPIGKLRQYYPHKNKNKHVKIDSVGIFKNGNKVKSLNDMNKAILDKEALFTRNLIKKMLTFAVGKEPTFRDEAEIQAMVKLLQENGSGMKALFKLAIGSEYFYKG